MTRTHENEDDEPNVVCRICLESDPLDTLVSPCRCMGSSRWVHRGCLLRWFTSTSNEDNLRRCEICHAEYRIKSGNNPHTQYNSILKKEIAVLGRLHLPVFVRIYASLQLILVITVMFISEAISVSVQTEKRITETLCPLQIGDHLFQHEPLYMLILDTILMSTLMPATGYFLTVNTYRYFALTRQYNCTYKDATVQRRLVLFLLCASLLAFLCLFGVSIFVLPTMFATIYMLACSHLSITKILYRTLNETAPVQHVHGITYNNIEDEESPVPHTAIVPV